MSKITYIKDFKQNHSAIAEEVTLSEFAPFKQTVNYSLPLYSCSVEAGFPTPADDHIESYFDLNERLIKHPTATFFLTASGDSMIDAGIRSGDMLIVDKHINPTHGKIVIAAINGQLTVKRLYKFAGLIQLLAANDKYEPIAISEDEELIILGVVTHIIHTVK